MKVEWGFWKKENGGLRWLCGFVGSEASVRMKEWVCLFLIIGGFEGYIIGGYMMVGVLGGFVRFLAFELGR